MKNYIKTFLKYRYMLGLFVKRDIEKKYKGAYLGILWSLLNPLLNMAVLTVIFSTLFSRDIENFPLYLITGRIILNFFSTTTNASLNSIIGSSTLLKKINFPKYMVVFSTVISNFILFLISFIDLFLIIIITKSEITWSFIFLPIYLAVYFIFIIGISLTLSILNAYFRDIKHLYSVFLVLLTYCCAIFYPRDIVPNRFQIIFTINPVYQFIEGARDIIYYGNIPSAQNLLLCMIYSTTSIVIGLVVFLKYKDKVIIKL